MYLEYHPRHLQVLELISTTPLFPSPPLSPLLPIRYSHTYTTATSQLLCHQSVTHPFHHDGGCTPLLHSEGIQPPSSRSRVKLPVVDPLCIQQVTTCLARNSFLLLTIHFMGGCTPWVRPSNLQTCKPSNEIPPVPLRPTAIGATIRKGTRFLHHPGKHLRSPRCLRIRERKSGTV